MAVTNTPECQRIKSLMKLPLLIFFKSRCSEIKNPIRVYSGGHTHAAQQAT
jgi:hypothetical protein